MKTKFDFKDLIKEVFWKGKTEMGVVWFMLIFGLVMGYLIKKSVY